MSSDGLHIQRQPTSAASAHEKLKDFWLLQWIPPPALRNNIPWNSGEWKIDIFPIKEWGHNWTVSFIHST